MDLFFKALRGIKVPTLEVLFAAAWKESSIDTLRLIFQARYPSSSSLYHDHYHASSIGLLMYLYLILILLLAEIAVEERERRLSSMLDYDGLVELIPTHLQRTSSISPHLELGRIYSCSLVLPLRSS